MNYFYSIDSSGMVIIPLKKDKGLGDSIGRTVRYAIAKDEPLLMYGPTNCYDGHQLYRHPSLRGNAYSDMSRDHYVNLLCGSKYFRMTDYLDLIVSNVHWRISDRFIKTIDLYLWERALLGKKGYAIAYYIMASVLAVIYSLWNWILTRLGGFGQEYSDREYSEIHPLPVTKWQKVLRKLMFPCYALSWSLLMVYVMDDSIGKKVLQRLYRPMIGRFNTYQRLLSGIKVSLEECQRYEPMRGGRHSTYLNERNNRWCVRIDTSSWADTFWPDKEIIHRLYHNSL